MEIPTQVTFTNARKVRKDQPNIGMRVWFWQPGDLPLHGTVTEIQGWEFESLNGVIDVDKVRITFDDKAYRHLNGEFHPVNSVWESRDALIQEMESQRKDLARWIGELEEMEDDLPTLADLQQERDEHVARERRELMEV